MQITTAGLIANPCDDEYDDMALLCCHAENGELFSLSRFPDEKQVEITVGDDKSHTVSSLKVTLGATRVLLEIDPADGKHLNGHSTFEIIHASSASELLEIEETLQTILKDVGTYIREAA